MSLLAARLSGLRSPGRAAPTSECAAASAATGPLAPSLLARHSRRYAVNWFNLSFIGFVILIIALAVGAYLLNAPPQWIGVGVLALLGVGMIVSVKNSKPRV
jgi:hypothetical protein